MEISRDVILDLLSLVDAGEASADSKALVEHHLGRDPELARIARERIPRLTAAGIPAPLGKETEMKTLERAKRLMSWRSLFIALGIFFAVFPATYSANTKSWHWNLIESPLSAAISVVLAALSWTGFFWIRHRMRGKRS